jgi:kinesin family member 6/9
VNVDKNEAYQEFKNTIGSDLNTAILKNIEDLKGKKDEIKGKTEEIQKKKDKLEELSGKLHQKEDNKTPEELAKNIIDEEEFELIKQKKVCKRDYKLELEKIKLLRNEIVELDKNITSLKTSMIQKFEEWFFKRYGISVADLENPLLNQNEGEDELGEVESVPRS